MRPMRNDEGVGGRNVMMQKQRLLAGWPVKEVWEVWEIHILILLSLFLQVFLFLTAGMRRHSASRVLRALLWLSYLLADSMAIFVLGHLAVHASGPRHHLMFFWAPFVLVHLGGQDTITAFSKQDNELWSRHLLSLVAQVAVAGYVVAKRPWPNGRLRAAVVLVFLSGCFKYAERTVCLLLASPAMLRLRSRGYILHTSIPTSESPVSRMRKIFDTMKGSRRRQSVEGANSGAMDIMSVDPPVKDHWTTLAKDNLPTMLQEFNSSGEDRYGAYEFVGARLEHCYQMLFTKKPLRSNFINVFGRLAEGYYLEVQDLILFALDTLVLICTTFQYVSTPIALLLFTAAEKGDHASRADIVVSYVLLLGAIVLDLSSAIMSICSNLLDGTIKGATSCIVQPMSMCCRKQWSEELPQYKLIKRHVSQEDTASCMTSMQQWIDKCLSPFDVRLFEVTQVTLTKDMKEFILDELVRSGTRQEWDIASSRGQLAIQRWIGRQLPNQRWIGRELLLAIQRWTGSDQGIHHPDSPSPRLGEVLHKYTSSGADFPTSVLVWHIATDLCYYWKDDTAASTSPDAADEMTKKHKEMSRQLSNYIMYLVFKCGVMLTNHSQLVHNRTHQGIRAALSHRVSPGEEEAFTAIRKRAAWNDDHSVLGPAHGMARELMSINNEAHRWGLIASVWSEMLYYTAPRCGAAFHYEHLSTGGEFVTHVLLLMLFLGPFLPDPSA